GGGKVDGGGGGGGGGGGCRPGTAGGGGRGAADNKRLLARRAAELFSRRIVGDLHGLGTVRAADHQWHEFSHRRPASRSRSRSPSRSRWICQSGTGRGTGTGTGQRLFPFLALSKTQHAVSHADGVAGAQQGRFRHAPIIEICT